MLVLGRSFLLARLEHMSSLTARVRHRGPRRHTAHKSVSAGCRTCTDRTFMLVPVPVVVLVASSSRSCSCLCSSGRARDVTGARALATNGVLDLSLSCGTHVILALLGEHNTPGFSSAAQERLLVFHIDRGRAALPAPRAGRRPRRGRQLRSLPHKEKQTDIRILIVLDENDTAGFDSGLHGNAYVLLMRTFTDGMLIVVLVAVAVVPAVPVLAWVSSTFLLAWSRNVMSSPPCCSSTTSQSSTIAQRTRAGREGAP
ncbi:hypothetical protein C8R46DRAFT_369245 [Mycena filopes]|nr:hypothetical protein C8R46DRAFT_369245 [Mycena filopes]